MNDLYREELIAQAQHPHQFGQLPHPDAIATVHNASCGDELTVMVKLEKHDPARPLLEVKWQGSGCLISRATASLLAQKIMTEKLSMDQVCALSEAELAALLGIDQISPGRRACLLLMKRAFEQARATLSTDEATVSPSAQ